MLTRLLALIAESTGPRSVEGLARALDVPALLAEQAIDRLAREGYLTCAALEGAEDCFACPARSHCRPFALPVMWQLTEKARRLLATSRVGTLA